MLNKMEKTKSQKLAKALEAAQQYLGLPSRRLVTPAKTHFSYTIHSFCYFLENNPTINYLYFSMSNITDKIGEQKPSLTYWSVTSTVVTNMQRIVEDIIRPTGVF